MSSNSNKNINDLSDDEFIQRLEMATQIHFLKKRIEKLEQERNDTSIMLAKMWNKALIWIWPRFDNYR